MPNMSRLARTFSLSGCTEFFNDTGTNILIYTQVTQELRDIDFSHSWKTDGIPGIDGLKHNLPFSIGNFMIAENWKNAQKHNFLK